jgi:putative DNA primase/helicase
MISVLPALAELQSLPIWVLWRYERTPSGMKHTKVPYQPDGRRASSTDPATWSAHPQVLRVVDRFDGVSIAVQPPYCGVDFDDCYHAGALDPWARLIVATLDSYTEITPSGEGLRTWLRGRLPGRGRNRRGLGPAGAGGLEVYDRHRFFTVTGHHLAGTRATIEPRQAELDWLLATHLPEPVRSAVPPPPSRPVDLDDRELVERASAARNGARFSALWKGDASAYPSHSEADFALCTSLAFWTGRDPIRMDRLFRASGLGRPKWDEPRGAETYGALTIARACAQCQETYAPRRGRSGASDWRPSGPTTETVTIWVG